MSKRIGAAVIIFAVAGTLVFLLLKPRRSSTEPSSQAGVESPAKTFSGAPATPQKISPTSTSTQGATDVPPASSANVPSFNLISTSAGTTLIPAAPDFTNLPPETVLENLRITFHSYQSMFGGNPVGTNPEITKALDGDNPKQAHFINAEAGMRINSQGEMIDPWGTPFFFHQLSGTEMEIHSAGPDRIMWTSDDLVIK